MHEFMNSSNKKEYRDFVRSHEKGSFMQTPEWADVKSGWQCEAVISRGGDGKIRGTCLVLIKKAPMSSLLYAPRGPVCCFTDSETLRDLAEGIDAVAKKYRSFAFVCDPQIDENDDTCSTANELMKNAGFALREVPEDKLIQCRFNYILKLGGRTRDEIWRGFLSSYRNQILKADKLGVICETFSDEEAVNALEEFYPMMEETGRRDGFPIRTKEYFARFLRIMRRYARLYICSVEIDGVKTPLSGAITINYGGRFSHIYGASANEHRKYCPNHKMQWTMICDALDDGCRVYDFGGVPYYHDKSRPEYGMYHFKKGFNGEVEAFTGQYVKVRRKLLCRMAAIYAKLHGKV